MRAGKLDQRITVWSKNVTGQNSFGEDVSTPVEVCTVWASVVCLQGRELDRAAQRSAEAKYEVTIRRQDAAVRRDHWIEWNGQTLDIVDVRGPGTRDVAWTIAAKDHVR